VEAAGNLARRVLKEKPSANTEEKIRYAFQLCTARLPDRYETDVLMRLFQEQFKSGQSAATEAAKVARELRPEGMDAAEFAAWYSVASAILNLDETLTKG